MRKLLENGPSKRNGLLLDALATNPSDPKIPNDRSMFESQDRRSLGDNEARLLIALLLYKKDVCLAVVQ